MSAPKRDLQMLTLRYVSQRRARLEIGAGTARTYRTTLGAFALSPGVPADPSRLTRRHVERWIEERGPDHSPGTIRSQLSIVRSFCEWMVSNGYRRADPTAAIRGPRQPQYLPRGQHQEAVAATFDACPDTRAVLIVALEVQQGLRACEVAGLELGDVDLERRQLLVRVTKGNGRQRVLRITDETLAALQDYLVEFPAHAGPLIRSYSHPRRGISAGYVSRLVSGWMHTAGVDATGHALRHTAATDMLRRGAQLRAVQGVLGHKSVVATERYLPWAEDEDLAEAMEGRSYRMAKATAGAST